MIPIHMLTKLARSRSQVAIVTKTFVTSGALWKQGGRKSGEEDPGESSKKLQQCCGLKDDAPTRPDKQHDNYPQKNMSSGPSEEDEYLEAKKQGGGSSCGPIKSSDEYPKEKQRTHKPTDLETDRSYKENDAKNSKPSGCSCPPYSTPKSVEQMDSKKEQKSTAVCLEKEFQKRPKEEEKCEAGRSRADPCENRKSKQTQERDMCHTQKGNSHCGSKHFSQKNTCFSENECRRHNTPKGHSNCGPVELSPTDACQEKKDFCSKYDKLTTKDSCGQMKSSHRNCRGQDTECGIEGDPCGKKSFKYNTESSDLFKERRDPCVTVASCRSNCPDQENECEESDGPCDTSKKQFRLDPCETSQKRDCSEEKEEECSEEQKENVCPQDPCKKEIKIPELPTRCKVDAAKECLCKLKELQRQWEEVIAAQEGGGKDDCNKAQTPGKTDCQEPARRQHKRSNMIYVVLGAILAAVVYYTYNEDFEPEELFLEDEEVKNDGDDDD